MDALDRVRRTNANLGDWGEAYARVEGYLAAHRMDNRLLIAELVERVLERAVKRWAEEPDRAPTVLAMEATDQMMAEWFAEVLGSEEPSEYRLLSQGRLAILLADLPQHWQEWFLRPGPLPEDLVQTMRESFVWAGPDFERSRMVPRPIDYGPVSAAAEGTWRFLNQRPVLRRGLCAVIILLVLGVLWYLLW